ncbi:MULTISPECIES: Gfo/Idh/MocA family protein [Lactobacillus]|uniref:Gfo/Idh/MocA family protein n=1 Tax=Lactobacillus TaxID=1578 RepID=UPI000D70383A|nr:MULTISPECIES: Gfo/Idh/MocA family oxidoreductase [Lactobacillus]AWN34045.1 NAD(P)-dependent oxidoreductase [Lactobacillus helsingborgensis]RMC52446.1 gfo/Idh/MocA family oxidoreductase [Lactobacillus sp. ESL0262]
MKLGIVGSGKIVHDFLTTAAKIKGLELAAISTTKRSQPIAKDLAKQYNIKEVFADNDQLCHDDNVDTVYVAVPNSLHYEVVKKAIAAGKNVICEKPYVETVAQAKKLKQLADRNNVIIVEAITNIHLPNYKAIKRQVAEIAPIHIISLNYTQYSSRYDDFLQGKIAPVFDPAKDGGTLMDLNIYNIHLCVGLFGKPEKVQYYPVMQKQIDTSGILNLVYPDKQAVLIAAKDSYTTPRSFIEGEKGTIYFDGSTGVIANFTVEHKDSDNSEFNFNEFDHRMASEFTDFVKIIDSHDVQKANELYNHSVTVMAVLAKAKESVSNQ